MLRHVAGDAIVYWLRMLPFADRQGATGRLMTAETLGAIEDWGLVRTRCEMRVMAGRATQGAPTETIAGACCHLIRPLFEIPSKKQLAFENSLGSKQWNAGPVILKASAWQWNASLA
jgi:hypothetical protein